jgi:glycosyltransferase involved in cell wall biosynthesis
MNKSGVKQKLWIVTELFYPDETSTAYILAKIANKFTSKFDVNVICGPALYDKDKKGLSSSFKISNDIKILRNESKTTKNNLIFRFITTFILSFKLFKTLSINVKSDDVVFIATNPPLLMLLISKLKVKKGFCLITLVHDVFPENTIPANILHSSKNLIYRIAKQVFDKAYAKSDMIIVLGSDMKEIISEKIKKYNTNTTIEIIQNWAETDIIYPIERKITDIKILYAGNIGRVQGLIEFLSITEQVKNSNISYTFAGSGAIKPELIRYVKEKSLNNVYFEDSFLREEQVNILNDSDICLITLRDDMYGLGVPSKAYNILAAGKPILFVGNEKSEIAQMIQKYDIGFVFSFKQADSLKDFLTKLSLEDVQEIREMGIRARYVAENYFSEEIILNKYLSII